MSGKSAQAHPSLLFDSYNTLRTTTAAERGATGGVVGWCLGFLLARLVKISAAVIGASLLAAGAGHQAGVINVDWTRVYERLSLVSATISSTAREHARGHRSGPDAPFSGGLVVGILLGVASS